MKKYIPVFGPQELFDGAPEDSVIAIKRPFIRGVRSEKIYFFSTTFDAVIVAGSSFNFNNVILKTGEYAERRIIKEPKRWTWEDKKAGRLPEVGAIVITKQHEGHAFEGEFVCEMTGNYWCIKIGDKGFSVNKKHIHTIEKPIETPEELAQRLRSEWVDNAQNKWDQSGAKGGFLEFIYDMQLSGELPPVQAKDGV